MSQKKKSNKKKSATQKSTMHKSAVQESAVKPAAQKPKTVVQNPKPAKQKKGDKDTLSDSQKALLKSKAIWLLIIAAVLSIICQAILKSLGIPFRGSIYEIIVFIIVLILESRAIYLFSVMVKKERPLLSRNLLLMIVAQAIIFAFILIVQIKNLH